MMRPLLALLLLQIPAARAQTGFPFQEETLTYTVNWPSGLSLGEGRMQAKRNGGRWEFTLGLDASLPGFTVTDQFRSLATAGLCSEEFEKDSVHGPRKSRETTRFDSGAGTARRTTRGGGSTDLPIPACARDALAFLYYTRREMGQGRVPEPGPIFFGGPYQIKLEYTGAQTLQPKGAVTDRVVASLKGPVAALTLEFFFARDAARTPLLVRVPLALGAFTLELVR